MKIQGSVALVTGANGGIGGAFVEELLKRGAKKVYVCARNLDSIAGQFKDRGDQVVSLKLDVTNQGQIDDAVKAAPDVTLLINNAGFAGGHGAVSAPDLSLARQEMEVNYFGLLALSRAFAPILGASGGGTIVNVLSFLSLVTLPALGTYSAAKSASLALSRSLRAELAAQKTQVLVTLPVQVETAMGRGMPDPKLTPQEVAIETLQGVEDNKEDVYPGDLTRQSLTQFEANPKGVQAYLSGMLPQSA